MENRVFDQDWQLLAAAVELLDRLEFTDDAPREQRWRTTEQLANELEPCDREALDRLDRILREHEAQAAERLEQGKAPEALIRRAKYPDRTTALPLWGSVQRHDQPWPAQGSARVDEPEPRSPALELPVGAPTVFLSHTHHDAARALGLAEALAKLGVGSWRFESHIPWREDIADCVRRAINETAAAVALVTRHSIASLWVLTELHTKLLAGGTVLLVVNAKDKELLRVLQTTKFNHPHAQFDTTVEYDNTSVGRMKEDYARHESAGRVVRYSSQVHDFLATLPYYLRGDDCRKSIQERRPLFAFPLPPAKWSGELRIRALEDLPAALPGEQGAKG